MIEADLLRRAREGDAEAFGALVRRHADAVYAFVRSRPADGAEAEDVSQEVFIAAHRGLRTLAAADRLLPWLLGIARHKLLERRRAARRRPDRGRADLDALPGYLVYPLKLVEARSD